MPVFEFQCQDCGSQFELLIFNSDESPKCGSCGSQNLKKLLSAHSSFAGASTGAMPGPGDTACCGSAPGHAGCAGPGSCCGKA
ncbi:putative regulatory protein, FmdB family [Desulfatibacillum alkenivorans DSM 16219]|uniref:Putative regulatory protein, FmdB family n=1 Tax=Desulfatibacillum alkenivorans DSM 16219 TaxID=1121393 RepID=A0A1M6E715_9BACT|nr:zinc ribbon domain-containing protein [Desulfatibacillum alkenivorans]SHI81193.1 putative regulatory protein, FmdB family [Desulfatibacillum alkenivorans DSM 16219]